MWLRQPSDLRKTQRLVSEIIKNNDAQMVIMGMGGGKTASTLDALRHLHDRFESVHTLVVAPRFVAANTWPDECAAWAHTQSMSYAVAVGDEQDRIAAIKRRAELTFINFDNLQWLASHLGSIKNWYWDTVVIDESSRMKSGSPRTKSTKRKLKDGTVKVTEGGNQTRFGIMTTARQRIKRIYLLTGTPAPQGIKDLWAQAYLLDRGERLGRSKTAFETMFFDKNPYNYTVTPKSGAEGEILKRLQDVLITIPDEKVADDAQFFPISVKLPDKSFQEYKEFEKTLYSKEYDVEAVSSGVLANKLLQFANGHLYKEDGSAVPTHEAKFEALEELVQTVGDESLLIFYSFKFDKDALKKRYPDAVVANEYSGDLVADWNKGKIKRLLAHPASIGHGTNLQYGGRIAAWFGLTFSLELWQQANMRLPRPGQTKQVLIYPIIAKGTYDERAIRVLQDKETTQDRVIHSFLARANALLM